MNKIIHLTPFLLFVLLFIYLFTLLGKEESQLNSALIGEALPNFQKQSLRDPNVFITNSNFKELPALLNVWATWCVACSIEHPFLMQLSKEKRVSIYGINYKDSRDKALNYLSVNGNPFKFNIFDLKGDLGVDLGVYGAPETFLISTEGTILIRHAGALNEDIWNDKFKPLLIRNKR